MEISEAKFGDIMVVEIKGRVDSTNAHILQKQLLKLSESESVILADCTALDYISSAGLGVFLLLLKTQQKKGGRFLLCSLNARIREVFEISGFNRIFTIFPSQTEAISSA